MHQQFVLITPQTSETITCGIQLTGVVTMAMKVLHNTCKICIHDLSDMNALIPRALGVHIRQSTMPMLQQPLDKLKGKCVGIEAVQLCII